MKSIRKSFEIWNQINALASLRANGLVFQDEKKKP